MDVIKLIVLKHKEDTQFIDLPPGRGYLPAGIIANHNGDLILSRSVTDVGPIASTTPEISRPKHGNVRIKLSVQDEVQLKSLNGDLVIAYRAQE
jgi:hypothetical protein